MNSKKIEEIKKSLKLSKIQRDVLVGLMLGDGHLESRDKNKTYRLKVSHSLKQKEYTFWLADIFKDWIRTKPKIRKIISPYSKKELEIIEFSTYSHSAFRFYYHQFYDENKNKIIPKIINKLLTPIGLAVWFMDDGSLKSKNHKTYIIHTDSVSKKDLQKIQDTLLKKFKIETSLHSQYKNWRLYIKTNSAIRFKNLISKYMIKEMRYKLGNTMPKK